MAQCQMSTYSMDQSPYSTTIEDLEIWTKQTGNEIFRVAVREWQRECEMIAERIRWTKDEHLPAAYQWKSRNKLRAAFLCSMLPLCLSSYAYRTVPYWWVVYCLHVFVEALAHVCWVVHDYRCSWRLYTALHSYVNKHMVYKNRIDMLNQKREFFSFEDDAKEYDPSSNSPPKLTWLLLACVGEVFGGLTPSIFLVTYAAVETWI